MGTITTCAVFRRQGRSQNRFSDGESRCCRHALWHPLVQQQARNIALALGTVVVAVNQGDHLFHADLTAGILATVLFTYGVAWVVGAVETLAAARGADVRR
ncbi:MAG: hypothetical protein AB7R89_01670 [Dehalococcoidia bacterium]